MSQQSLAFEIGTEEIPAFDLSNAVKQLQTLAPNSVAVVSLTKNPKPSM